MIRIHRLPDASCRLPGRHHELIPVRILEDGEGAPGLFGGRAGELHAARAEFVVGPLHVVALKGDRGEGSDAVLVPVRREQDDAGFRARNGELDPTLLSVERLIGEDAEAEFLGVEGECAILVGDRNGWRI